MFTYQALKNEMTIFWGDQTRPNIHIKDIVNVYLHFIKNPTMNQVVTALDLKILGSLILQKWFKKKYHQN